MTVRVTCPTCGETLRVPEERAGSRVRCPCCEDALRVPQAESAPADQATSLPDYLPMPLPARLGVASLALGLLAVLVLCVPFVGYASPALSALGVLLGLGSLINSPRGRGRCEGVPASGGAWAALGGRAPNYPLAGVAACLAALGLFLLPYLFR
jgi:hypothetical protein